MTTSNKANLGEVEFSVVEEESPEYTTEITERTVERGTDIADHIRSRPVSLSISGVVVGDDAAQKLSKLREYARKGEVLRYVGRNIFANMVIQSFPTSHTYRIRNGFSFQMELKEVRFARPLAVQFVAPDPVRTTAGVAGTASQTKSIEDKGTQQSQEKEVDENTFRLWIFKGIDSLNDYFKKTGHPIDTVTGAAPKIQ